MSTALQSQMVERCSDVVAHLSQALQQRSIAVVAVAGESGYGKTTFLEQCRRALAGTERAAVALVLCPAPLGTQAKPIYQPLYPFVKAIEQLLSNPQQKAKRRLVLNIGLSVLGMIPLIGSLFDVTKEVLRDMREYRRETDSQHGTETQQMAESLLAMAEESPLVLLLDDAQWLDAASIEVLEHLVSSERRVPLGIVLAYEPSVVEAQNPAVGLLLTQHPSIRRLELPLLSRAELRLLAASMLECYQPNPIFDEWLLQHSGGVPGIAAAYLQYFRQHPPFAPDGTLRQEVLQTDWRPASLHVLIEQTVAALAEDEKLILATCAAEGMQCTVFVASQLLQRDPIATVRLLRSLQQRTGVITSLGMQRLYGTETTVYAFTHVGYYRFFAEYPEYEERVELHSRIAAILEQQAHSANDDALSEQLAPLIAAHYVEAGNNAAAAAVFEHLYHDAVRHGHELLANYARHEGGITDAPSTATQQSTLTEALEAIIEQWARGAIHHAYRMAQQLSLENATASERVLAELVQVRLLLDVGQTEQAQYRLPGLISAAQSLKMPDVESLAYSLAVVLDLAQQRLRHGWEHAQLAASRSADGSLPVALVALTNGALLLRQSGNRNWRILARSAQRLAQQLGYSSLADAL
ncbi:MAG: hypothetical protein KatS3mg039_1471 [Candidatus Kapaibacterium sp.]|nr:MAG: hypothetical protein KatS3mg039_1471 [Candidatus Kapabacteria bacterium]